LEVNTDRFPFTHGEPRERLKQLADRIRTLGYKGVGLWVACQKPYDDQDPAEENAEAEREYWEERAKWCDYADIAYWKVDWGRSCKSAKYREMMTDAVRKYAPRLLIEHAYTQPAYDVPYAERLADNERSERIGKTLAISDFIRAYDVVPEFRYTTMFGRTAEILRNYNGVNVGCLGIINIEDPVQIGAALGCSLGIMRHQIEEKRAVKQTLVTPFEDAVRAVMWQRIAPPFGVHESDLQISDTLVSDKWDYPQTGEKQWPYLSGRTIIQDTPAAISRGMSLPKVETDGILPLVGCSKHPNGAVAVGSFPRTLNGKLNTHYPAHVTLEGADPDEPIGVFGVYKSLTVVFDKAPSGRLLAQDLAADTAIDVTDEVTLEGNKLTVSGDLITKIGLTAARDPKHETPGVVFKFINA
ncbi:MAG: hypothetical protein IJD67_03920, partial [Clostridia bacterium]|nr:hypothetical protein [Clostridia bacterium]